MANAPPAVPSRPCLEDVLSADGGHQIWEFLEGVSDHPRLFCTSRKLNRCKQIPQVAQLRYNEERKLLEALVVPEEDKEYAEIQRALVQKMAPYIQSGNYYLARRTQGSRGKTDEIYCSVKDGLKEAVQFCFELCESGSFQEGWEGMGDNIELADGIPYYAKKEDYLNDPEHQCVNQFCRHRDNPEKEELILYRVDGEDHDQMYCGTCMDNNLYLQLRFAARHGLICNEVTWDMGELRDNDEAMDNEDDDDDAVLAEDDDDVIELEEPTTRRLLQVNLWEWRAHACHASRSLWFVGTEATADDKQLDGTTKQRLCKRQKTDN